MYYEQSLASYFVHLGEAVQLAHDFSKAPTRPNPSFGSAHSTSHNPDPFLGTGTAPPTRQHSDLLGLSLFKHPVPTRDARRGWLGRSEAHRLALTAALVKVLGFCKLWDFPSQHSSSKPKTRFL